MKTDTEHKQNFKEVWHHYFRKEDIFLIPNLLCYFRIALIAVFLVFYFHPITILGNQYANIYLAIRKYDRFAYLGINLPKIS